MKKNIFAAVLSVASLSAGVVFSVGPDSGGPGTQDYSFILDSGNSVSINRSTVTPKVSGKYADGSVINSGYSSVSNTQIEAKWDYNGTMLGISTGSPYLIDLTYKDGFLTNSGAKVTSNETAIVASRSMADGFKVFGGIRLNQFKANINLPYGVTSNIGTYSVAAGYQYALDTGTSTGFSIGAAYEVPQIMLRASVQYNSEIKHSSAKETETIAGTAIPASPDDMIAPSSMIVKLRSALSPRLLAFANWRSSQYKPFKVTGNNAGGAGVEASLYNPESGIDYTIGVALKVNESMNLALATGKGQSTDTGGLASALAPFKGSSSTTIGGSYKISENVELNASYSLISFGDDNAFIPPASQAPFTDNKGSRVSIGTKISF